GHVRGAFTGAKSNHVGLLQRANGGTLFIDEVADIPLNVQAKLLRALEYHEFCPVGGTKPVHVDFRLISATHQDLRRLVREGAFRHDLFYRLVTFEIHLPPLRERQEDIDPLAKYFLGRLAAQSGKAPPAWSEDFRQALLARPWWGNVRELRHALEHALIVSRGGVLHADHLPPSLARNEQDVLQEEMLRECVRKWVQQAVADPTLEGRLYEMFLQVLEPVLLEAALEIHRGQYIHAARHLGIHRVTLRKKLQQYRQLRRFADRSEDATPAANSDQ
uniref:sigma 54-interacting transcriptional regulator n=1 Tax=Thermogutta sp. TaxID=1962930 RepID=UPI003220182A